MKALILFTVGVMATYCCYSQMVIERGSTVYLDEKSALFVEGDVDAQESIDGRGSLTLCGGTAQKINFGGNAVPDLTIDNSGYIDLAGPLLVNGAVHFTKGKLRCNDFDLTLGPLAVVGKEQKASWIETNGAGVVKKTVTRNISNFLVPLGVTHGYTPAVATATGVSGHGTIAFSSKAGAANRQTTMTKDYLNNYWTIDLSGATGSVNVVAGYTDGTGVKGNESEIAGFYREKLSLKYSDALLDRSKNVIRANVSGKGGELFATNAEHGWQNEMRKITMTPNPVYNYGVLTFYAQKSGKKEIIISDESGRIVRRQVIGVLQGLNRHSVNMQGLARGYYNVMASGTNEGFFVLKK